MREAIVAGVNEGITSLHGLIAHGRGEAFDYLVGEMTQPFALRAVRAAAVLLRAANHPVISVNGNAAALVPGPLVELAEAVHAPLEVNLFHASRAREEAIRRHLIAHRASDVLMPTTHATLPFLDSNRRFVHPDGILKADVIFVPLEDGDRCEALRRAGKEVVTVDLNPLSRTARAATVTIVDNVVRALPSLLREIHALRTTPRSTVPEALGRYDNARVLAEAVDHIRGARP
jgi:4-phosphopantoate--beta-alanine ligase